MAGPNWSCEHAPSCPCSAMLRRPVLSRARAQPCSNRFPALVHVAMGAAWVTFPSLVRRQKGRWRTIANVTFFGIGLLRKTQTTPIIYLSIQLSTFFEFFILLYCSEKHQSLVLIFLSNLTLILLASYLTLIYLYLQGISWDQITERNSLNSV